MKRLTITTCLAGMLAIAACNNPSTADNAAATDTPATAVSNTTPDSVTAAPEPPMDSAAMMKAWGEYMTPGDMHKMLASFNGTWKEEITTWMDPSAPPTKSTSVCTNKMILGGRYQQSTHKGSFDGMPFEGISTMGFDNATKKLVSTWVDNMGTGIMNTEGTYDAASKTATFTGSSVDPMTGKMCQVREVMTFIDDKHQKMEMYNTKPGQKEVKTMEIVMTKQ